jgi:hypothetical protein
MALLLSDFYFYIRRRIIKYMVGKKEKPEEVKIGFWILLGTLLAGLYNVFK